MNTATGGPHAEPAGRLRLLVVVLVGLEAAMLIAGAVVLLVAAARSVGSRGPGDGSPAGLLALAAIALVVGAGLAVCARGVLRAAGWSRGPLITWQLLQAGVGMPLSTGGSWPAGVVLLAVAIVVGALVAGPWVLPRGSAPAG